MVPYEPQLLVDDNHGIYIPQIFAKRLGDMEGTVVTDFGAVQYLLEGPENDKYWDAWYDTLQSFVLTDHKDRRWTLHQDGDLWLVPEDYSFELN